MDDERTCTAEWLVDVLARDGALLIDCRPQADYALGHIVGSINVSLPMLLQRRLRKGNLTVACAIGCGQTKDKFVQRSRTHEIVLYDANAPTAAAATDGGIGDANAATAAAAAASLLALLLDTLTRDGCKAKMLLGGYTHFQAAYPSLVTSADGRGLTPSPTFGFVTLGLAANQQQQQQQQHTATLSPGADDTSPLESACPVEVVSRLFLGDAKNAADLQTLERYNIKYILNVTPNLPNQFQHTSSIKYKQIPVNDHWSQNVLAYFPEAIAFIDEGRSHGVGVLVHCLAGVSRSVTVTVAYLMARQNMSLNEAYDFVKRAKPNISPNFNFMGQLLDFEHALKAGAFPAPSNAACAGTGNICGPATLPSSAAATLTSSQPCALYFAD